MTRPRSQLVSIEATPYYHCISRCVRRAFLCGADRYSGKTFDHRKPWLLERLSLLANTFAIDVAAYAVMSNHYHLVLHLDPARAASWTDAEVIERWQRLYKGSPLLQAYAAKQALTDIELRLVDRELAGIREKLGSLSRFMACLNEYIARKANAEDKCTGRFWEGRFKSQALLDEAALVSCMTYVDLNPVRAGIAANLEESEYTSVQSRISQVRRKSAGNNKQRLDFSVPRLMPFSETITNSEERATLPFNLKDYLDVTDWTGRAVRTDKKGHIGAKSPRLLSVLGLSETQWKVLALDIQKQSITMLDGLMLLDRIEKKAARRKAA